MEWMVWSLPWAAVKCEKKKIFYDPGQVKNTGMESENKFTSKNHI